MLTLTKRQRRGLESTLRFHNTRPPSVGDILRLDASAFLAYVLLGPLLSGFVFAMGVPIAGIFLLGMFAGAVLRMIRVDITYVRNWPVVDRITQWELVEALVHPPAPGAKTVITAEPQS